MRKIKFRGVFKIRDNGYYSEEERNYIESKQHEVLSISIGSHYTIAYQDTVITVFEMYCSNYDLLQFTGLTDKNGKEIYEGDIIRVIIISHHRKYEIISDTICPTTFENGIFGLIHGNRHEFKAFSAFSHNVTFEIIGNIHDNPELLQK